MIRLSALRRPGLMLPMLLAAPAAMAQNSAPPAPPPAPAQIANPQPGHPAYADLIDAIDSTVNREVLLDKGLEAVKREMLANADLGAAEQASPGLIDEILAGMRPVLNSQNLRVTALYRPKMIAAMASYLTPEEARSVSVFYRSDIGRRLMGNVVANFDMEQTLSSAVAEKDITEADVRADINSAVSQGISQMDAADLAEMGRQALTNPALLKLQNVNPQIQRLRAQMENEPLTPAEDAEIARVVEATFAKRFPQ
jgi:hypothetical protein